jgi:hypothetical protein
MLRGTIVMWKISLILVAGLFCLLYAFAAPISKEYWENVGPTWDRMLNPCDYEEC